MQLLKVPYKLLYGPLILFIMVGGYSLNNSVFDLGLLLVFGLLGYGLRKLRFDTAPLILAYVLGGAMELNLRQTLMLGRGSWEILLGRPIALTILVIALVVTCCRCSPRSGACCRRPAPSTSFDPDPRGGRCRRSPPNRTHSRW
ncbi:tripartite tricarboxylate transporter permease [Rhodoplanes sp. SY1]|uniref:tripartite tricarboxylate transporter permease n=1 Tax=Rhodoplanes sp. SY1 TaxID=3166646 RepID=UPI0038B5CA21